MLFRARKRSSGLLAALFLSVAGCSLDGLTDLPTLPEGEGEESAESTQITGVIVDGYVEGAHVFLDLDGDQQQDADEPSASSDARGAFTLEVVGFDRARFAAAFLQAEIPDTAKDSDDMGRTLREAGKKGFTLLSPASALVTDGAGEGEAARERVKPAVLSPLSTLVAGEMIERGLPLAQAKAAVQSALGLPDKELLHDFVASSDQVLHNVARAAAVSLGEAAPPRVRDADAGVAMPPGMQVVQAVRSVREQLPQLIEALDLRAPSAPAASPERVRAEYAEQVKRTEEARAAQADAGVRSADPTTGRLPPAADTGVTQRLPPLMPTNGTTGAPVPADAGMRLPPLLGDGGSASSDPLRPVPPPPGMLPGVDAGAPAVEPRPADAGPRPDAGALPPPPPSTLGGDAGYSGYYPGTGVRI